MDKKEIGAAAREEYKQFKKSQKSLYGLKFQNFTDHIYTDLFRYKIPKKNPLSIFLEF